MDLKEKSSIEKWKIYLTVIVMVVTVISFLAKSIFAAFTVENRMFDSEEQKIKLIYGVKSNTEHSNSLDGHMPYELKVEKFVTRPEYNVAIKSIGEALKEIKEDVKYIRRHK